MMGTHSNLGAQSPVLLLDAYIAELIAKIIVADKWLVQLCMYVCMYAYILKFILAGTLVYVCMCVCMLTLLSSLQRSLLLTNG
jgi:hypothetical protein